MFLSFDSFTVQHLQSFFSSILSIDVPPCNLTKPLVKGVKG